VESDLRHPHCPRSRALQADVAGRYAHARQFRSISQLAIATSLNLTVGERMAGKMQFERLLESRTPKYVMFDVTWCGGLTEARKIAALADAQELPYCAAHGRRSVALLRVHPPHHGIAQRMDPGKLPEIL